MCSTICCTISIRQSAVITLCSIAVLDSGPSLPKLHLIIRRPATRPRHRNSSRHSPAMQFDSICMPNPDRGVLHRHSSNTIHLLLVAFLLVHRSFIGTSAQQPDKPSTPLHPHARTISTISKERKRREALTKVIRTTLEVIRGIQALCEVLGLDRTLRCLRGSLVGPLCLLVDGCLSGRGGFRGAGGTKEPTRKGQYVQQKGKQEVGRTCWRYRVR
jgi:hypothetical protein